MSIGLILEGGGMRGAFTTGVLDYLMDQEIWFDHIIGVSAGACHACSYASRQRGRSYAVFTDYLDDPRYLSVQSLLKTGDIFGAEFIYHEIPEKLYPIDNEAFIASGVKLQVVTTNCETGLAEYPQIMDMFEDMPYVRASSSLPLVSRMVPIDGGLYLDGGITDSIPVRESIRQGNKKNVVILTQPLGYRKDLKQPLTPAFRMRYRKYPRLVEALIERNARYNETLELIEFLRLHGDLFVIAPMGDLGIGRMDKDIKKLRRGYQEGYYVTEGLSEKLRAFLEE
ncbi:MAG: patatin family protein [Eubacterium sp.]|nr:patatin family protein [Eubacterium sp.]